MENQFKYAEADLATFDHVIKEHGWIIYEDTVNAGLLEEIINSLNGSYQLRRKIQEANGIAENMEGTLHHLVERDTFTLNFLNQKYCDAQIRRFLGGNYIINSLGAVINTKSAGRYVQNVHRDIRSFTGDFKLMIQFMVILDDFTLENGATWFLSGSHKADDRPDDDYFYKHADRAVAKKGSMIAFDANLWHAAGKNYTDQPRRALTGAFTRPFFKPQLDYPRALGYAFGESLNDHLKQVLGYNARIPENLNEYYQPIQKRMYQPGQG